MGIVAVCDLVLVAVVIDAQICLLAQAGNVEGPRSGRLMQWMTGQVNRPSVFVGVFRCHVFGNCRANLSLKNVFA